MPNWCSVQIEIVGPTAQLTKLKEAVDTETFLQTICPAPADVDYDYNWCVENWGTKWECGQQDDAELEELATAHPFLQSKLTIAAQSAWSPPLEALATFQEANPELFVKCYYYEGGMDFGGKWDGESEEYLDDLHAESIDWTTGVAAELDGLFGICEEHAQYDEEMAN